MRCDMMGDLGTCRRLQFVRSSIDLETKISYSNFEIQEYVHLI